MLLVPLLEALNRHAVEGGASVRTRRVTQSVQRPVIVCSRYTGAVFGKGQIHWTRGSEEKCICQRSVGPLSRRLPLNGVLPFMDCVYEHCSVSPVTRPKLHCAMLPRPGAAALRLPVQYSSTERLLRDAADDCVCECVRFFIMTSSKITSMYSVSYATAGSTDDDTHPEIVRPEQTSNQSKME